jgi:hypothetical protein
MDKVNVVIETLRELGLNQAALVVEDLRDDRQRTSFVLDEYMEKADDLTYALDRMREAFKPLLADYIEAHYEWDSENRELAEELIAKAQDALLQGEL